MASIFKLFVKSPIRPLQEHMAKAFKCAKTLLDFFDQALVEDWAQANELHDQINILESEADDIKRDIRLHLPKGLFLPVPRTDLLELLSKQDRIANKAEDIADIIMGRKMQIPPSLVDDFKKYLHRSIDAAKKADKAIRELDELFETGFQGNEMTFVEGLIHELDRIERDTDKMQINLRHRLFEIENDLSPIHAIFLYKVIEWIGDLADRSQQVGKRLQILMAK